MKTCRTCKREKADDEFPRGEIVGHQCKRCRKLLMMGNMSITLTPKMAHVVYWVFITISSLIVYQLAHFVEMPWILLGAALPVGYLFLYGYHCFVKKDYKFPFGFFGG